MKRVLIITCYWPPAGGSGVQRWLKFTKYLRETDWEPVIYTPENPDGILKDESLLGDVPVGIEVIRRPIFEPYRFYRMLTGKKSTVNVGFLDTDAKGNAGFTEKLFRWIRGNFFIPDARKFWVRPSISYLNQYLEKHPVQAIVSTGPPHSMHLIALGIKKKHAVPWLADFRDPWTGIDFYDQLLLTRRSDQKHHQLEKTVLQSADVITTVSESIGKDLGQKAEKPVQIEIISNGFDPDDFDEENVAGQNKKQDSSRFDITHTGLMVPSRNPEGLWKVLSEICSDNPEFKNALRINIIGKADHSVKSSLQKNGLSDVCRWVDYVPHAEAVQYLHAADVLLLVINRTQNAEGFLSGKVFEYLAARKPILGVGPAEGAAADVLNETQTGKMFDYDDHSGMKNQLLHWFDDHQKHGKPTINPKGTERFNRRIQTRKLAEIFNRIIH